MYVHQLHNNWDIYQYELSSDSITQLTSSPANEKYPVMLEKHNRLAFSSDRTGEEQIYFLDLNTGIQEPVIKREIHSKAASFPVSEYLFYFLGFDELHRYWALYRYELKYNSLKQIYPLIDDDNLPKVSPDGELIMFVCQDKEKSVDQLNIINWYGNTEHKFSEYNFADPCWYPGGLKIIFVSDMNNNSGEIYTIWNDGTHLERWTNDTLKVSNPVVSPDGKYLAVSVLIDETYDLFVIPLEDY